MKAGCTSLVSLAAIVLLPSLATADVPRGTYIEVDPSSVELWDPAGGATNGKLFLNRCANGCTVSNGQSSSLTDRSNIVFGNRTLTAWSHGDEAWNEFVDCVAGIFEPLPSKSLTSRRADLTTK